jgi:hypothetical protein
VSMRRVWHTKLELYRRLNKLTTPGKAPMFFGHDKIRGDTIH